MAFFDFDRKIQTLLIAGALASLPACSSKFEIDGATDGTPDVSPDQIEVVDPPPDMLDPPMDTRPDEVEVVDPVVDVLDDGGLCPDPAGWGMDIVEASSTYPRATLRVTLNIGPEYVDLSDPTFTVDKKTITDVRPISTVEYEVDYMWEGPLTTWWDWDRLNVSWHVRCDDSSGIHERTLTASQYICVDEYNIWLGLGSTPEEACMVVDCVPDTMTTDAQAATSTLARGLLQTKIHASPQADGTVRLGVIASGPGSASATCSWTASAGTLEADGARARWLPPAEPGVYTVQVTTRSGKALSINVYRVTVKE